MESRFENFTVLINRISRNIRKIKNGEMAEYNLRSAHISCLYYLNSSEGLTATELCEKCEEDKATVSRALDYLETEGYVICRSKHIKKYKSPINLTEEGRKIAGKISKKIDSVLEEVSAELTEEERAAFYRSLFIISDSLDKVARRLAKNDGTSRIK